MTAVRGYALLWHDTAEVDGRPERFEPYAFLAPICAKLVTAHDLRPGAVLARTGGGALKVEQDDFGARFEAEVDGRPERFEPYAFLAPICAKLVTAHDLRPGAVLARTGGGALKVEQDDFGARFEAELDDADPDARRVLAAVAAGTLNHCSFTFRAVDQDDGPEGVTVHRARLSEVSLCSDPAYAAGGCWLASSDPLPSRLAELRRHWQARATSNRPARIDREVEAFAASRRWAAGLAKPAPQACAVGRDPVRQLAGRYVGRYVGGR